MTEKLGEKALEAMKQMDNAVVAFKLPKVPKAKKGQMKILTEEQYIEELGKIIQKDFFPDLKKLQAQNEYLEAMERNDIIKLREIYAKYSGSRPNEPTGAESPATFETPQRDVSSTFSTPRSMLFQERDSDAQSTTSKKSRKAPSDGHTLDSFLSTHTSEDNCSFQEIIETADKKLRQKFSVLFDAEQQTALAIERSLDLPCIEDQFNDKSGLQGIVTWTYKNKNSVMYIPDGVELTQAEQLERATKRQSIEYGNTRFNANPFNEQQNKDTINELAKSQANNAIGRIGIDGNSLSKSSAMNAGTRGFSFVATPSPRPGVAESPLMTWGELEGTPFRLDGSDTPLRPSAGPSFHIAETSRRETIALSLAEKAGERMRNQNVKNAKALEAARRNISSPHIRSTMDRLASMSPAAKRLASSSIGIKDISTPSPRSTPNSHKSHTPSPLVRRKTPLVRTTPKRQSSKSALTDDLLNIPFKSKRN